MANVSYTNYRNSLLGGDIDLLVATIKIALVRNYTYNATHKFLSEVTAAGATIHATSAALANKTTVGGVFDADDITLTTAADANPHTLIAYQSSALTGGADVAATAQLLCWYFDTGVGIPITPTAGSLTIIWPTTAAKIYKIG